METYGTSGDVQEARARRAALALGAAELAGVAGVSLDAALMAARALQIATGHAVGLPTTAPPRVGDVGSHGGDDPTGRWRDALAWRLRPRRPTPGADRSPSPVTDLAKAIDAERGVGERANVSILLLDAEDERGTPRPSRPQEAWAALVSLSARDELALEELVTQWWPGLRWNMRALHAGLGTIAAQGGVPLGVVRPQDRVRYPSWDFWEEFFLSKVEALLPSRPQVDEDVGGVSADGEGRGARGQGTLTRRRAIWPPWGHIVTVDLEYVAHYLALEFPVRRRQ